MNSQNEPYIACKGQIIEESSVEDKQEGIDIMDYPIADGSYLHGGCKRLSNGPLGYLHHRVTSQHLAILFSPNQELFSPNFSPNQHEQEYE
ncbi:MAG: hypothetical protein II842_09495 [Butyrivibrio sp.]|nr:hypothetical protein [Butyrivibrio sp.]